MTRLHTYFNPSMTMIKQLLPLILFGLSLFSSARAEEEEMNYFLKSWQEDNAPVLLLRELQAGEWGMNKPCFFRDGFSGDGPTRLLICRVVLSSTPAHKPGTLVLFEHRSDAPRDAAPSPCPWWLARISKDTPAIPLTAEGNTLYIYGEDTCYLNGRCLTTHPQQLKGIWLQMANEVTRKP